MKKTISALCLFAVGVFMSTTSVHAASAIAQILGTDGKVKDCQACTNLSSFFANVGEGETIQLLDGATDIDTNGISIELPRELQSPRSFTFDLNGHTLSVSGANSTIRVKDANAHITIKNGTIKYEGSDPTAAPLKVLKGEANLEDVKVENTNESSTGGTIQVGNIGDDNTGKLTVNAGTEITGQYGITYFNGSTVTINDGTINAKVFALSGNGSDTQENTVTINGGNISSESTAIYQPSNTKLTINNGKITAENGVGVAVRQGTVDVKGGTITASGTGKGTIGAAETQLNKGVAILVDNKTENYGSKSKVTIAGGNLNSAGDKTIESYTGNDTESKDDFVVTGGAFDKAVNPIFMGENEIEISIGDTYMIGNTAKNAIKEASKNGKTTVEIIQGDLEITGAVDGFTVKNLGNGTVKVNGTSVTTNNEYSVVNPKTESNEKDPEPETGDVFSIALVGIMTLGLAGTYTFKKLHN